MVTKRFTLNLCFIAFIACTLGCKTSKLLTQKSTASSGPACPQQKQLVGKWRNMGIEIEYLSSSGANNKETVYPNGYIQLNANGTYYRESDQSELDGAWAVDASCRLVLDKGTRLERVFDIQKVTGSELVITRKDVPNQTFFVQKYAKY